MESIMESLANSVAKMLLGEHIAQQASFSDTIAFEARDHSREFRFGVGWVPF